MGKNRLEAFSDSVIAIMVLELKPPHGADFRALLPLWPVFMSYVLSFVYVGIYWNKLQYVSYPTTWLNLKIPGGHHSHASKKATFRD
jgi:uncharacterized membrane protein